VSSHLKWPWLANGTNGLENIDWNAPVYVSLHTGPVTSGDVPVLSGTRYTRHSDITWTQVDAPTVTHYSLWFDFGDDLDDDDPYNLLMPDATTTGIGDPLADVLRSIDDLLEGQ
jgi:hypothetical protein